MTKLWIICTSHGCYATAFYIFINGIMNTIYIYIRFLFNRNSQNNNIYIIISYFFFSFRHILNTSSNPTNKPSFLLSFQIPNLFNLAVSKLRYYLSWHIYSQSINILWFLKIINQLIIYTSNFTKVYIIHEYQSKKLILSSNRCTQY